MTTTAQVDRPPFLPKWIPYRYPVVWHPQDSKGRHLRFSHPRKVKLDPQTAKELRKVRSTLPCRLIPTGSPTQKQGAFDLMVELKAADPIRA